MNLLFVFV